MHRLFGPVLIVIAAASLSLGLRVSAHSAEGTAAVPSLSQPLSSGAYGGSGYDIGTSKSSRNQETLPGLAAKSMGGTPLSTTPDWTNEVNQAGAQYGISTGTAGDVNGDGFDDVLVGAFLYDNGQSNEGRAYVYLGSASGLSTTPAWSAESDNVEAHFGVRVSTAGDVNGDGFSDVIIGADLYTNGQGYEGAAFVYMGSASGLSATPAWRIEGGRDLAVIGFAAANAGDVNGDGYGDVIVGGHLYSNDQSREGIAQVYLGSASGLSTTPAWVIEGNQNNAEYGVTTRTAGDVNGDGFDDVIVGADHYSNGQSEEGRAFVYLGSASGLSTMPAWSVESNQSGARLGFGSVGTAGDVNGDGYADVFVAALRYSNGQTSEGRVEVYLGSGAGLGTTAAWTAESDQSFAEFGRFAASAGDVDADGFDDLIVGSLLYDNGQTDEGAAFVFLGSASGLTQTAAWMAESNQGSAYMGFMDATAGDVNGDGASDVIVGAYSYDNGQTDEGFAWLYHGVPSVCTDLDGDGYGSPGSSSCTGGAQADCDDGAPDLFPGAVEQCDGRDENCDGSIDDGFDLGTVCSAGVGACERSGVKVCEPGGAGTICNASPGQPVAESCDGSDDDCDGQSDEEFDAGAPCSAGLGACARSGIKLCAPDGNGTLCNAVAGIPAPETCDGIDNDCDGIADDNAIKVQASSSIAPTTLNVNAQGTSFTMGLSLLNVCDPSNVSPIDGVLLERAHVSRVGSIPLPDPLAQACPRPDGDVLFERGIADNLLARGSTVNGVTLRFNLASDGDCRTLDGDRQDLLALLSDALDRSTVLICVASSVAGVPFESCTSAEIKSRGNR